MFVFFCNIDLFYLCKKLLIKKEEKKKKKEEEEEDVIMWLLLLVKWEVFRFGESIFECLR